MSFQESRARAWGKYRRLGRCSFGGRVLQGHPTRTLLGPGPSNIRFPNRPGSCRGHGVAPKSLFDLLWIGFIKRVGWADWLTGPGRAAKWVKNVFQYHLYFCILNHVSVANVFHVALLLFSATHPDSKNDQLYFHHIFLCNCIVQI